MGHQSTSRREVLKYTSTLAAAGVAFSVTGCIGDDDPGDTPTPDDTDPDDPTPTPDPGVPQELHLTQQVEPAHDYDPVVLNDAYSARIANHIFDGLYEYGEAFELVPKLATGDPEIERDGRRIIVEIVDNAVFHNGDPVTAEDVLHTFIAPVHEATDNITSYDMLDIEESTTVDEHTVQFELPEPYAPFTTMTLASNVANKQARLDAMGLTEDEWWDHDFVEDPIFEDTTYNKEDPIGSGPFQYVDHVSGDFADIVRWDDYWDDPLPTLESVRWVATEDDAARTAQIRAGDTDIITGIAPPDWEVLEEDAGVDVYSELSVSYFYLAFNINEGPTANPDVRHGIDHCFSMTDFVESIIGPAGANAISPLPEALLETWDLPIDEYAGLENEYDPELAADLLSGNVPDGWDPILMAPPDDIREALCERVASRLQELPGLDIQPRVQRIDWPAFLERYATGSTDDYTMYALGWTGGPDPDAYLYPLFHESSAGVNQGHFYESDTGFHDWIAEGRTNPDFDTRRDLYEDVIREILEEKVHIPGYNMMNSIAALPEVADIEVHAHSSIKPRLVSDHHNVNKTA